MAHELTDVGLEWLVDASGCDPVALASLDVIARLFDRAIEQLQLHPIAPPRFHQFPDPGGITGFVMLSESHLACHTYPELGAATFNLYCCRERPEWNWSVQLRDALGATDVRVVIVRRQAAVLPMAVSR
jgi:S-adenosylmethionine decarboxylase